MYISRFLHIFHGNKKKNDYTFDEFNNGQPKILLDLNRSLVIYDETFIIINYILITLIYYKKYNILVITIKYIS